MNIVFYQIYLEIKTMRVFFINLVKFMARKSTEALFLGQMQLKVESRTCRVMVQYDKLPIDCHDSPVTLKAVSVCSVGTKNNV